MNNNTTTVVYLSIRLLNLVSFSMLRVRHRLKNQSNCNNKVFTVSPAHLLCIREHWQNCFYNEIFVLTSFLYVFLALVSFCFATFNEDNSLVVPTPLFLFCLIHN